MYRKDGGSKQGAQAAVPAATDIFCAVTGAPVWWKNRPPGDAGHRRAGLVAGFCPQEVMAG
ncbi:MULTISPECIES: hypothetical protein [unclassified Desulfovibrio]|uniref:hypothetical protein n=1 Tax=unclassified Desulfovibrio TaxID=2593640 RepID=UPI002FDA1AF0